MNMRQSRSGSGLLASASTALALGCALFAGWFAIGDPDLGLHLAVGKYMAEHQAFPEFDPFTYSTSERPFINFEWGFDYGIFKIYEFAGAEGILLAKLLIIASIILLLLKLASRLLPEAPGLARWFCALSTIAALPVLRIRLVERPHLLGFLFLVMHLFLARDFTNSTKPWKRRMLPVLMVLSMPIWASMHGSWPLALAVAGAHFLFSTGDRKNFAAIFGLEIAATTLNPYGTKLLWVPFRHLGSSEVGSFITEWMRPELTLYPSHTPLVIAIGLSFAACLLFLRNRRDAPEILVTLALFVMASRSFRFISPALLIAAAPMGARLGNLAFQSSKKLQVCIQILVFLVSLSCYYGLLSKQPQKLLQSWSWEERGLPRSAAKTILENELPGPIFNDFDFGGDLSWTLGTQVQHAIDGRVDLFGNDFLKDYVNILKDPQLFVEHSTLYKPQLVILSYPTPRNHKLIGFLSSQPEYLLIHLDDTFAVWARGEAREQAAKKGLALNRFAATPNITQTIRGTVDDELASQLERVAESSDTRFAHILYAEFWWRFAQDEQSDSQSDLEKVIHHANKALSESPSETFVRIRRGQAMLRIGDAWKAWPDLLYTQAPHTPASMKKDLSQALETLPAPLVRAFVQPLLTKPD